MNEFGAFLDHHRENILTFTLGNSPRDKGGCARPSAETRCLLVSEHKESYGRDNSRHIQYIVRTKWILLLKRLLQPPCPGLRDLYGFDGSKLVTERTLSGDITAFRPDLIKGLR